MKYDIVKMVGDEHVRYSLTNKGDNPLIVFGINPSTADKNKPDPTMRRVMGFAERYGFDSFVMLNVYPLRATNPAALPQECDAALHTANIQEIVNVVSSHPEASILMPMAATSIAVSTYDPAFATSWTRSNRTTPNTSK